MHSFVGASGLSVIFLDGVGQFGALLHVLVLHEIENDIAFGRVGVEARIAFLVVFFVKDYGVFALGHIEIFAGASHSER